MVNLLPDLLQRQLLLLDGARLRGGSGLRVQRVLQLGQHAHAGRQLLPETVGRLQRALQRAPAVAAQPLHLVPQSATS